MMPYLFFQFCDANLNILCVDPSYPGSTHDSVVWANNPMRGYLERLHTISGEDLYVLGKYGNMKIMKLFNTSVLNRNVLVMIL